MLAALVPFFEKCTLDTSFAALVWGSSTYRFLCLRCALSTEARTLLHGYFRPNTQHTAVETHGYPKYLLAVDINIDQVLPSEAIVDEDGSCDVECFV